eukprot:1156389-Pelagomonas_calceolata.AAC.2
MALPAHEQHAGRPAHCTIRDDEIGHARQILRTSLKGPSSRSTADTQNGQQVISQFGWPSVKRNKRKTTGNLSLHQLRRRRHIGSEDP